MIDPGEADQAGGRSKPLPRAVPGRALQLGQDVIGRLGNDLQRAGVFLPSPATVSSVQTQRG